VGILTQWAPTGDWIVSAAALEPQVVARGTFAADEVDVDGWLAGSFTLPAGAPPTIGTVARWVLHAHVRRSWGLDRNERVELTVLGPEPDELLEAHSASDEVASDWLLRIVQKAGWTEFSGGLAPTERERDVWVELSPGMARPGEAVTGQVVVRPTRATWHVLSGRQRRHMIEHHEAEFPKVLVSLECWRGSRDQPHAWGRLLQITETLAALVTLAEGEVHEFPFEIQLPTSVELLEDDYAAHPVEAPAPASFYGSRKAHPELGDVRWRVLGEATTDKFFVGWNNPLWGAKELLVAAPET
jgi:hypothetical protein